MSEIPTAMISRLIPRYAEPHRRYHTWSHIGACFDAIERIVGDRSQEVALALLYHDAVYDPLARAGDNEERSAALLMDEGKRTGVDVEILKKACTMILATKHDAVPETEQACAVVDADLSILGADEETFDRYDEAIREEYAVVPDAAFATGRAEVMRRFLGREHIFATKAARDLWEAQARKNIARCLGRCARMFSQNEDK